MANKHLSRAAKVKNDEYYTRYEDVAYGMKKFKDCFNGKIIYCPADDYRFSNFTKYFKDNFNRLEVKKLVCTNYDIGEGAYLYVYDGNDEKITPLEGNGDFLSDECKRIMDDADIVVTNPPFSIFSKFTKQIDDGGKDYIFLGTILKFDVKGVFDLFWFGRLYTVNALTPTMLMENGVKISNIIWYSSFNVDVSKRELPRSTTLNDKTFQTYDHHPDILFIEKIADIPYDYDGLMAVPMTILYYNWLENYEFVGFAYSVRNGNKQHFSELCINDNVGGRKRFRRIIMKKK